MINAAYSLDLVTGIIRCHDNAVQTVADGDELDPEILHRRLFINSLVRSGDYFITLATKLDALSKEHTPANNGICAELDRVVSDLMYLQYSYEIVKKAGVSH